MTDSYDDLYRQYRDKEMDELYNPEISARKLNGIEKRARREMEAEELLRRQEEEDGF